MTTTVRTRTLLVALTIATATVAGLGAAPASAGGFGCLPHVDTDGERWVCSLYDRDFAFAHDATEAETAFWVARLAQHGHGVVAAEIQLSAEAWAFRVRNEYLRILNRAPDDAGAAFFFDVATSSLRIEPVILALAGSDEYFAEHENDIETFLIFLYSDLLERQPEPGGAAFWTEKLESGTLTRAQVADALMRSDEYLDLTLEFLYDYYLRRDADAAGADFWRPALRIFGERILAAAFTSSPEGIAAGSNWPP